MVSGIAPTTAVIAAIILTAILIGTKSFSLCFQLLTASGKRLNAALTYNWLQYMAATLKAGLIMRLKLFWMPYNAILASVLLSPEASGLIDIMLGVFRYEGVH